MAAVATYEHKKAVPLQEEAGGYVSDNGEIRVAFTKTASGANAAEFYTGGSCWRYIPQAIKYFCMETGFEDAIYEADHTTDLFVRRDFHVWYDRSFPGVEERWRVEAGTLKHFINLRDDQREPLPFLERPFLAFTGIMEFDPSVVMYVGAVPVEGGQVSTDGELSFVGAEGQQMISLPPIICWDQGQAKTGGQYVVTPLGPGRVEIATCVDYQWLNDPARVPPVVIDPTIVNTTTNVQYSSWCDPVVRINNNTLAAFIMDGTVWATVNTTTYQFAQIYLSDDDGATWQGYGIPSDLSTLGFTPREFSWQYSTAYYEPVNQIIHFVAHIGATASNQIAITRFDMKTRQWLTSANLGQGRYFTMRHDGMGNLWAHMNTSATDPMSSSFAWYWIPQGDWAAKRQIGTSGGTPQHGASRMALDISRNRIWLCGYNLVSGSDGYRMNTFTVDSWTNPTTITSSGSDWTPYSSPAYFDLWVDINGFAHFLYYPFNNDTPTNKTAVIKKYDSTRALQATYTILTNRTDALMGNSGTIRMFSPNGIDYYIVYPHNDTNIYMSGKNPVDSTTTWEKVTNNPGTGNPSVGWTRGYRLNGSNVMSLDIIQRPGGSTTTYYTKRSFNEAPLLPSNLSPAGGAGEDRAAVISLAWTHNDSPGDPQSKFDLRWRLVGAAAWNDITATTPNQHFDAAAGYFPYGLIEWQVRTCDQSGAVGPWSDQQVFFAGNKPATPTITSPASGAAVGVARPLVTWSSPDQKKYEMVVADPFGVTVWTTGEVPDSDARVRAVGTVLENGRSYTLKLHVKNADGVWSDFTTTSISVSYTPPARPVVALQKLEGYMSLTIMNPAPQGTEPLISQNEIYRREGGGPLIRIETVESDGRYDDFHVAAGKDYEYVVRAIGANGTVRDSEPVGGHITLSGIWLHLAEDPSNTSRCFLYNEGRGDDWTPTVTMHQFAGRKNPVAEFGTAESSRVTVTLKVIGEEQTAALLGLLRQKKTLCYRDQRGRKVFGVVPTVPIKDTFYGGVVSFEIRKTDYKEEV